MLLWLGFAVVSAAVLIALLHPLLRQDRGGPADADAALRDIAIYKDQLAEVDAERERGQLGDVEAEAARAEIGRRLIAAEDRAASLERSRTVLPADTGKRFAVATVLVLPLVAGGLYLKNGSPSLPDQPLSARNAKPADPGDIGRLITAVERRLKEHPEEGQGWDVIAPVYFRMQRYDDAAAAFATATRLLGETSQRLAGFAEATVMAHGGEVTDEAKATYEKLAVMQPDRVEPKFWLALAKEQRGQTAEAMAAYKALLASAPADAPWRPLVEERMAGLGKPQGAAAGAAKPSGDASPPKGPSTDDVKAAEALSEKDRAQMVAGMVDGLAKRLQANPQDPRGWQQLVQSYAVLGQTDKAKTALADAQRHLAGNAEALGELAALGKRLGL